MNDTVKGPTLVYDAASKRAVITFPNGRQLALSNVNVDQANNFLARHAGEFMKRDCCLQTVDGTVARESSDG